MNSKATNGSTIRSSRHESERNSMLRGYGVFLIATLFLASAALGQSVYQGTISGTVADQTGAAITNAHVQIINEDTHFVNPATTNGSGAYTAPFLPPGTYDVKVDAQGFAAAEQTGAALIAGANKEVDFHLKPASASASVTVTANRELLETGSSTIDTTLTAQVIENTPNTGNTVFYLSTRVPGVYGNFVQGSEKQNWVPQSNGQIAGVNGVSGRTLVNYDGLLDTDMQGNPGTAGGSGFSPVPFTTQELSVKTAEFDAQYGHNSGGVYDLILKSGTEQFHGDASITDENTAFDANAWQRKLTNPPLPRPQTNWVDEAGAITGPVRIPGLYHGRDRTYFMFGYRHLWFSLPQQTSNILTFNVPTLKERNGDFSEMAAIGGNIYDPTTTVPLGAAASYAPWCAGMPAANGHPAGCFAGERESFTQEYSEPNATIPNCNGDINCIPQSRWNTAGATLAGALAPNGYKSGIYPAPNTVSTTPNTPYVGNYQAPHYAYVTYLHQFVARVDHEFNDSNKIHVSYSRESFNQISNDDQGFPDDELGSTWVQTLRNENLTVLDYTHVINPTTVVDLHSGFDWHPVLINREGEHFNPTGIGMTGSLPAPLQNFPGTTGLTGAGGGGSYQALQVGQGGVDNFYFWDNTAMVNKAFARHNFKMGGEYLLYRDDDLANTSVLGTFSGSNVFTQNDVATGASNTNGYGDGLASLMLGYASGDTATINPVPAYGWNYYAGFVQDDWRVNNRLTLNLGVRYDYESEVTERHNWMNAGFNPNVTQPFCLPNALGTGVAGCSAPATTVAGSPGGYFGGLTFVGNGVHLPFTRELLDRFQPRFGGAYRVTSRDVLRGGFGLTIGPQPTAQTNQGFSANTTMVSSVNANYTPPTCTAAQGGDAYGYCTLTNPFPNGVVEPTGNLLGPSTFLGQAISFNNQNYSYPHTYLYVMGLQHQFPSQFLLDVSYHGAYTSGLGISKNINALPACYYASMTNTTNWASGGCTGSGLTSVLNASVANPMAGHMPASSSLNSATTTQQNLDLPFPQFGGITETFTKINGKRMGVINYNGLYIEATKRMTHGLDFHVSATWAKIMDQLAYTNPTDLHPSHYVDQQPSRFLEFDMVYHLPGVRSNNLLVKSALNGWIWANSENWDQATGMGWPGSVIWTGANAHAAHQSQLHWFNNCVIPITSQATGSSGPVFGAPYSYTIPTSFGAGVVQQSGCNAGESPAWIQLPNFTLASLQTASIMGNNIRFPEGVYFNSSIGKNFPIHDRLAFEFRADCQNVVNNAVIIGTFNATYSASAFGEDTGPTQNNDPRYFRLTAMLHF